ncbi:hypothetical protein QOZ80_2BG0191650 [Eleusine coracana subsp. coracana]|nr:hypothetical protein QOZ80_2BG0191650 [Eleusine coracana subsp. coracana]
MAAPSDAVAADDEDYEICNDNGFVYKRRRGLYPDVAPASTHVASPDPEAARRRCRRRALLHLRAQRLRELERWEALERKLQAQPSTTSGPPPPQASPASPGATAATSHSASVLDDLLARAEVEEAILKKVSGLCDEVDALCRAHEEDVVDAITTLPLWGDPKDLLLSLQSPDVPGNLNFIKDHMDERNELFECRIADWTKEHIKRRQVHLKKVAKQLKGFLNIKNLLPSDDVSILTENRKKKRITSPSGSRSSKKSKRIYQSTSPNPISFSSRPTTRRTAAAEKMLN